MGISLVIQRGENSPDAQGSMEGGVLTRIYSEIRNVIKTENEGSLGPGQLSLQPILFLICSGQINHPSSLRAIEELPPH